MIVQLMKFASALSDNDVRKTLEEQVPPYIAPPNLIQKLYIHDRDTGK